MLEKNSDIFDWLNIKVWHDAGYTGTKGLTATQEGWDTSRYNYKNQVVMGDTTLLSDSAHPINTAKCFFEIAPDRKLIQLPYKISSSRNETSISATFFATVLDTVRRLHVDVMFGALVSPVDGRYLDHYLAQVGDFFTYYMNSSSDSGEFANQMVLSTHIHGIGAYELDERTGFPKPIGGPTIVNRSLAYVPTHLYIPYANTEYTSKSNCRKFSGASCAAPIMAGMMSLVNDFFISQTGLPLSNSAAKKFIRAHSTTIGNGFRLFRLPNPEDIDIKEYLEGRLASVYDINDGHQIDPELVDEVLYVLNKGYMHLDEEGNFAPDTAVTRIELAAILARILRDKK